MASTTCGGSMAALSSRSAMVRATRKMRARARDNSPSSSIARPLLEDRGEELVTQPQQSRPDAALGSVQRLTVVQGGANEGDELVKLALHGIGLEGDRSRGVVPAGAP